MQIVFDFIAGDIPFDEFWEAYCADPKIGEWLDSIADFSHEPPQVIAKDHWLRTLYRAIASVYDGHMLKMLEKSPYSHSNFGCSCYSNYPFRQTRCPQNRTQ